MISKYILIFAAIMLLGCYSNENLSDEEGKDSVGQVLLLQVDYTTNEFEGGKELRILKKSKELIITHEYIEPSDFGSIKSKYFPLYTQYRSRRSTNLELDNLHEKVII